MDVYIRFLRAKLDEVFHIRLIETVRGRRLRDLGTDMAFKQSPPLFQVPGLSDAARQLITRLFSAA